MCVLCGQDFVARVHWTDRHIEDRARAAEPGFDPVAFQGDRRRDRAHRVVLTNEVLRHYGLRVDDWSGSKDLGSLWPAAAKLAGRTLDPLDPVLREMLGGEPAFAAADSG
jgi:hypothetical protein